MYTSRCLLVIDDFLTPSHFFYYGIYLDEEPQPQASQLATRCLCFSSTLFISGLCLNKTSKPRWDEMVVSE